MNQENNNPSELETQLSSIAMDAVRSAMNLNLSPQEKEQIIKDAKALSNELLPDGDTWVCDRFSSSRV